MNGADPDERTGTSILLKVMAGDKVEMNVDNYYDGTYNSEDDQPVTAEDMLNSIVTTLTTGTGGLGSSESHNPDLVPRLFNSANYTEADEWMHQSDDPSRPKAFLNYILFDEHMQVVRTFTGAWQANGSSAMGMTLNRQKYQSNEYITEAGLNWMSFGARQYDPQIGRFLSVDPLAGYGDQDRFSPYAAMGDEPVDRVDPFGYIDTINLGGYHIPKVQVTAERLVYVTAPDPIGMEEFNAFWGAISAGGYWATDYGGGGPSFGNTRPGGPQPNSSGTLQTLSQSIDHNSGKSPDVATNSDGKEGYNSNYQGKTGDEGTSSEKTADLAKEAAETVEKAQTVITSAGLADKSVSAAVSASKVLTAVGKVTGILSVGINTVNSYNAFKNGNYLEGSWDATKALVTTGFLLFGGEELELAWNVGTLVIDTATDGNW